MGAEPDADQPTRRFGRAVRLPEGDISAAKGTGVSKSAVSRRFVALSAERMAEWMAADLSELDLLIIQIDGIQIEEDLTLLAAIGIDGDGGKHPLGVIEGATENAAVAQALLDNLIGRGLDPKVCRLFIIDGAKALAKAIRRTFGRHTPIQRCQVHKARNIRNLARRLEHEAPGVSASILEGIDEILTVTRLGLPVELRRSLACTNVIENMNGTIRQVCRNVKRWRDAKMVLRWTGAAMLEAAKGFRRLKARKQLPILRAALTAHQAKNVTNSTLEQRVRAA